MKTMMIRVRASNRLKASRSFLKANPQTLLEEAEHLKTAMSIMMGRGMRVEEERQGSSLLLTFRPSQAEQDLSATDFDRLSRALLVTKAMLTIHCDQGKPAFTFELKE